MLAILLAQNGAGKTDGTTVLVCSSRFSATKPAHSYKAIYIMQDKVYAWLKQNAKTLIVVAATAALFLVALGLSYNEITVLVKTPKISISLEAKN